MQIFDAKVRLGGSPLNEVRKRSVPAPEIMVLRAIHGPDAVVDLSLVDDTTVPDQWERLLRTYGRTKISRGEGQEEAPVLSALFGMPGVSPLPERLPDFVPQPAAGGESDDGGSKRKPKRPDPAADFVN